METNKDNGVYKNRKGEFLYYGINICKTIFTVRSDEIIKVYITQNQTKEFKELLTWCARQKKAYHITENSEMEKVTGSVHHGGIALIAKAPAVNGLTELKNNLKQSGYSPILFMDGVQNPHNIGIIMRTMAHFGWSALVGGENLPGLSAAAARMSEGGCEFVNMYRIPEIEDLFGWAKGNGYKFIGTSSHSERSLYGYTIPRKSFFIIGDEVEGMSRPMIHICDEMLKISGTDNVESLNVSVACSIILGEYFRQQQ